MEEGKIWLSMSDMEPDENLIWFIPREINAIFSLDIHTGKTEFKHVLDLHNVYHNVGYMRIIKFGDKLFVIPFASTSGIKVYDIINDEIETIEIRELDSFSERFRRKKWGMIRHFLECEIFEGKMYLIGIDYPAVVEVDLQTYECKYYDDYINELYNEGDLTNIYYLYYFKRNGDSLLCPSSNSNVVVEFNMKSKSFVYHKVGSAGNQYCYILGKDNKYWLFSTLPHKGITTWNYTDNNSLISADYPIECDYSQCPEGSSGFYMPVWSGTKIIQFPDSVNMAIEYDMMDGKISKYKDLDWFFCENELQERWFTCIRQIGDFTYAYVNSSRQFLMFDESLSLVKRYAPYLDYDEKRKLVSVIKGYADRIGPYTRILYERDDLERELFISYRTRGDDCVSTMSDNKFVGQKIYDYILKL